MGGGGGGGGSHSRLMFLLNLSLFRLFEIFPIIKLYVNAFRTVYIS